VQIAISNTYVRQGLLLLCPENVVVLGGQVQHLEEARQRVMHRWNQPPRGRRYAYNGVLFSACWYIDSRFLVNQQQVDLQCKLKDCSRHHALVRALIELGQSDIGRKGKKRLCLNGARILQECIQTRLRSWSKRRSLFLVRA
jgi:hypothetical protein